MTPFERFREALRRRPSSIWLDVDDVPAIAAGLALMYCRFDAAEFARSLQLGGICVGTIPVRVHRVLAPKGEAHSDRGRTYEKMRSMLDAGTLDEVMRDRLVREFFEQWGGL